MNFDVFLRPGVTDLAVIIWRYFPIEQIANRSASHRH